MSTQVEMHFASSLATHVEVDIVSSLACEGFGQHMLGFILFPLSHWLSFLNTCCDTFCVLACMASVDTL